MSVLHLALVYGGLVALTAAAAVAMLVAGLVLALVAAAVRPAVTRSRRRRGYEEPVYGDLLEIA